jgi:hypothetical protein
MSHGIYDRCVCGHPHPEHSMFGTCHGCLNCTDDIADDEGTTVPGQARDADDDHPYRQCTCRKYVLGERGEPSLPSEASVPAEHH